MYNLKVILLALSISGFLNIPFFWFFENNKKAAIWLFSISIVLFGLIFLLGGL